MKAGTSQPSITSEPQLFSPDGARDALVLFRWSCSSFHQCLKFAALCLLTCILAGCVKISGSLTHFLKGPDFKKSSVIVANRAIANGSDPLVVYAHLMNSDNSVVPDFKPTYRVTAGNTVLPTECFPSDKNGLSICVLKAISPGTRTIQFDNITAVELKKDVVFIPIPLSNNQLQIVSGSDQAGSAGPYKVKATVGNTFSTIKQTSGNYTVYGSVQGGIIASGASR